MLALVSAFCVSIRWRIVLKVRLLPCLFYEEPLSTPKVVLFAHIHKYPTMHWPFFRVWTYFSSIGPLPKSDWYAVIWSCWSYSSDTGTARSLFVLQNRPCTVYFHSGSPTNVSSNLLLWIIWTLNFITIY